MHAPAAFRVNDVSELAAFVEARHFGTLVVAGPNGPQAAHVPMLLNRDEAGLPVSLECHVAKSNPVAALAAAGARALAIFNGADAYVTPSLYLSKQQHGRVVPTWNYIAVEIAGDVIAFNDGDQLRTQIGRMTDAMEQPTAAPWSVSDAPDDFGKPPLEFGDLGTGRRTRIEQPSRGVGQLVIVRVARRIEQRAQLGIALALDQTRVDQHGFAAAGNDLAEQVMKGDLGILATRQHMDGILERHRANRLQAAPDFHAQIRRFCRELMQQRQPVFGTGCINHSAYVSFHAIR